MSSDQNQKLVRRFFDEMCNGRKLNLAEELYAPNHVYRDPASPTGPGPQGIRDVIAAYHTGFSNAQWTIDDLFAADGDRVVALWTGTGTQSGELLGIPPTRKSVRVTGTWTFKISGGKIVESWNHWDALGMLQQLGVVPTMAASKK